MSMRQRPERQKSPPRDQRSTIIREPVGVDSRLSRAALALGATAGPIFAVTALVEGILRPDYHPVRHPISSLSFGPRRSVQIANFLLTGAMYAGLAIGLSRTATEEDRSRAVPILVGTASAGLILSGLLTADPVSGYPLGTPDKAEPTTIGTLHNLAAVPLVIGLSGAAIIEARRSVRRGQWIWAAFSAFSATSMPSGFVLSGAGFAQHPKLVSRAGLVQRLTVGTALGWATALAIRRRGSAQQR